MEASFVPLKVNAPVKEIRDYLNKNNPQSAKEFNDMLNRVVELESLLEQSTKSINQMRSQLDEMKEIQKHPIKMVLTDICDSMTENVEHSKSLLAQFKDTFINICKKILQSIKDVGLSTLDKGISFIDIQGKLEAVANKMAKNNVKCVDSIKKIEAFSNEYNKAGNAIKNMGRILTGKATVDNSKENGKLCKALTKPYRAFKTLCSRIERKAYTLAKKLENFHTVEKIKKYEKAYPKTNRRVTGIDVMAKVDKFNKTKLSINKENPMKERTGKVAAAL